MTVCSNWNNNNNKKWIKFGLPEMFLTLLFVLVLIIHIIKMNLMIGWFHLNTIVKYNKWLTDGMILSRKKPKRIRNNRMCKYAKKMILLINNQPGDIVESNLLLLLSKIWEKREKERKNAMIRNDVQGKHCLTLKWITKFQNLNKWFELRTYTHNY